MVNGVGWSGRMAIGATLAVTATSVAFADARSWVSGADRPAEVVLTLRSVDEADSSLRALTRAAEIEWLPRASRLLEATNLSAGIDTGRSLVIAMLAPEEGAAPAIVSIVPSTSAEAMLGAFGATPVDGSSDLHRFSFAGVEYAGRVLPDGHFAISGDPEALRSLSDDGSEVEHEAPVRVELRGAGSVESLEALLDGAGVDGLPADLLEPFTEIADRVVLDLTPDSESLRAEILITPIEGSDLDLAPTEADDTELSDAPFPATDYVCLAHGRLDHPLFAEWMNPLLTGALGLDEDDAREMRSASLLVSAPETLFGSGGATVSIALEGEGADLVRASVRRALAGVSGATVEAEASSRVGVALDHIRFSPQAATPGGGPNFGGGIGGMLLGGGPMDPGADQSIGGRMFSRNGRVYLTSATEGEKLDRLIAFSDRTTSVEAAGPLGDWLDRLGRERNVRMALNIAPLVKWFAGAARMGGTSITLPDDIAPVVAGMTADDEGIRATVLIPAEVLQTLEQFRRAGESMGRDR